MKKYEWNEEWTFWAKGGKPRRVTLPHDAMLEAGRNPESAGGSACGYFTGGVYQYEKVFDVPAQWAGKHVLLQFEGVYQNAVVSVNGKKAGGADYGYIPFFVELDGLLDYGKENRVAVTADNSRLPNSRWYTGGGIYRPVWLWVGEREYVEPEGIRVTTLSYNPPRIRVRTETAGSGRQEKDSESVSGEVPNDSPVAGNGSGRRMRIEILDQGQVIAEGEKEDVTLELPGAKLWSEDTPYLYRCLVTLESGDVAETSFGIRKVEWDSKGLYINGRRTLLRGGCVHHDSGILGAATVDAAEYRRVKKLKEAGYNAIRSSHNPCSRAMLEACDKLGVYMMDEAWDMWYHHKNKYDYADQWKKNCFSDLKAIVDRDFNHPSVILYSIGNEVSEPAREEGLAATREMVEYLHGLDPGRAVTGGFNLMIIAKAGQGKGIYDEKEGGRKNDSDAKMQGMNSTMFNMLTQMVGTGMNKSANSGKADEAVSPCLDLLDMAGYNYASGRYPLEGKAHPDRLIFGSETFPQDIAKNWEMVKKYPYLIGDFMWTAWDYLGEAGLGAWAYTPDGKGFNKPYPWLLADCGAFDICGNPGAPVALARAAWGLDEKPWIGVQPVNHPGIKPAKAVWRGSNAMESWSWRGCEGNAAIVEVYSSAVKTEVFLNGKSLGKKPLKKCRAVFKTKYMPGKLEAVAYDASGQETGRNMLVSGQGELKLSAETERLGELSYISLSITDENGVVEQNADETLTVTVEGGELLGFGSANPRTEEDYREGRFTTYYGRALAIVRGGGKVTVNVKGRTFPAVTVEV